MERNLQVLPRFEDCASFLYVERSRIERKDSGLELHNDAGLTQVPIATIATLVLGPGTNITHAAIVALSEAGTTVLWMGEEGQRFYAAGVGKVRSSGSVLLQALAWSSLPLRMEVVRRMYSLRFDEALDPGLSIAQIRGKEGARVRDAYADASSKYGVKWSGRSYKRESWDEADQINRCLSTASSMLYGICHGAICSLGFSPAIGFVHTGKALSFVYDIADLYKTESVVPAAFEAVGTDPSTAERSVRRLFRERLVAAQVIKRLPNDLNSLFASLNRRDIGLPNDSDDEDTVGALWGQFGPIEGGRNYGGNDS